MGTNLNVADMTCSGKRSGLKKRRGSWDNNANYSASSLRNGFAPTYKSDAAMFRNTSVPEPTCLVLTLLTSGVLLVRRKRSLS
jgi:hypothetical protein